MRAPNVDDAFSHAAAVRVKIRVGDFVFEQEHFAARFGDGAINRIIIREADINLAVRAGAKVEAVFVVPLAIFMANERAAIV